MIDEPFDVFAKQPDSVIAELERNYQASIPAEKKEMERLSDLTAKKIKAEGSQQAGNMGQKMCEIPARIVHRWQQALPGCWQNEVFVHEFLADNPQFCCNGWKPYLHSSLRHSFNFKKEV